jgi:hypothetical protein
MKARMIFHGAAILVLAAVVAAAPTPTIGQKPAGPGPAAQSADR